MQYWLKDMEYKLQLSNELVDISNWEGEEESFVYPVGAREKKLLYCPSYSSLNFLEPGHRYLFKLSAKRCPEQFWIEIFAYRLGFRMEVDVPPAFVAFDSKSNQFGALSRWFLEDSASDQKIKIEKFESGGDILQGHLHNFDRKKGGKHNFLTIAQIFERDFLNLNKEWRQSWAKIFIFDALIGNTDRHQDNWGLISGLDEKKRISPAFDNGTSMGYEIKEDKFDFRTSDQQLPYYVNRGFHHMKWQLSDTSHARHIDFLLKFVVLYPETRITMTESLRTINPGIFREILMELTEFNIGMKLSERRANFMLKLITYRHNLLLRSLE